MGIIKPTNTTVENLKGLHLYHAGMSNCAMRVRIALQEKGLKWTSHLLNLMEGENLSKDYFGINPNGVVPTLVDNGVVIIDSADIIDYLDKKYSPNSLRPTIKDEEQAMYDWMYLARDNHLSIKTYMYSNVATLNKHMKRDDKQMTQYRKDQTFDAPLLAFHEKFNSNDGFTEAELAKAKSVIDSCFQKMDNRLANNDWLAGDNVSLADIAWIPQLVILNLAKYPFSHYPNLEKWKNCIINRPSFQEGVVAWLPKIPTE